MEWLVCSQILPVFLHTWFIFWLDWPLHEKNNAAGWASPWEDDVLVSSCSEISLDSMHRNSNNNNSNNNKKIIEVISREILYSVKCIKLELTSAAFVSVLRPVGNHQIPCELSSFALFVVSDGPLHWWSQPWQCWSVSCSPQDPLPSLNVPFAHPQDPSLLHVLISTELLCSALCQGEDIPDLPQTNKSPCAWK